MSLFMGYPPIYMIGVIAVLLSILAFCRNDTIWGTLIKMFNVFFATMVAVNFFEPVANMFDGFMSAMAYYNDMIAFFLIFCVTMEILVEISNRLSKVNVAFSAKTNLIGNYILLFVLFVGFYSVSAFVFMTALPEAPRVANEYRYPPTLNFLQYTSRTSLKPMGAEPHQFEVATFLKNQNGRN
ncbi:MAG: hypothetical protein PHQ75_08445, partial [Thermoguttaceae bacterium]|nr:hypothetical protein [Thermoguttaceae bacterium]